MSGFHKIQPHQRVRILTIQIAVPDEADPGEVADEISAHLSENGIASDNSLILDWRYPGEYQPILTAGDDPDEGEIFEVVDVQITLKRKE